MDSNIPNERRSEPAQAGSLDAVVRALAETKAALRKAILSTSRSKAECTDYDPAGSTYEVDWLPEVKEWAKLADLDLEKYDPGFYQKW